MVSVHGHGIGAAIAATAGLWERLVREGWVISSYGPGRTYWRSPAHPGLVASTPDPGKVLDAEHFCRGEHEFLDRLALDAMPTSLKLAARDLLGAVEAYYARHKCGCGRPACHDCERDRRAETALAKAREVAPWRS